MYTHTKNSREITPGVAHKDAKTCFCDQGGIQFLSDELSEVSRNRQLTVQFLRADFAAVSEVSGKNLC